MARPPIRTFDLTSGQRLPGRAPAVPTGSGSAGIPPSRALVPYAGPPASPNALVPSGGTPGVTVGSPSVRSAAFTSASPRPPTAALPAPPPPAPPRAPFVGPPNLGQSGISSMGPGQLRSAIPSAGPSIGQRVLSGVRSGVGQVGAASALVGAAESGYLGYTNPAELNRRAINYPGYNNFTPTQRAIADVTNQAGFVGDAIATVGGLIPVDRPVSQFGTRAANALTGSTPVPEVAQPTDRVQAALANPVVAQAIEIVRNGDQLTPEQQQQVDAILSPQTVASGQQQVVAPPAAGRVDPELAQITQGQLQALQFPEPPRIDVQNPDGTTTNAYATPSGGTAAITSQGGAQGGGAFSVAEGRTPGQQQTIIDRVRQLQESTQAIRDSRPSSGGGGYNPASDQLRAIAVGNQLQDVEQRIAALQRNGQAISPDGIRYTPRQVMEELGALQGIREELIDQTFAPYTEQSQLAQQSLQNQGALATTALQNQGAMDREMVQQQANIQRALAGNSEYAFEAITDPDTGQTYFVSANKGTGQVGDVLNVQQAGAFADLTYARQTVPGAEEWYNELYSRGFPASAIADLWAIRGTPEYDAQVQQLLGE